MALAFHKKTNYVCINYAVVIDCAYIDKKLIKFNKNFYTTHTVLSHLSGRYRTQWCRIIQNGRLRETTPLGIGGKENNQNNYIYAHSRHKGMETMGLKFRFQMWRIILFEKFAILSPWKR